MPEIKIVNVVTGEEIVREMTPDEVAQMELDEAKAIAEQKAKADSIAKLEALGLSVEDLKAILG